MNPQKIAILTDSCADLTPELIGDKPVFVVPLRIQCVDGDYADGVDITAQDIYRRLAAGELPRTSLPTGAAVEEAFCQIRAAGYQRVIAIHLSSGLSGTFNMVRLHAQEETGLQVAVFDSLSGALGIGITVLQLAEDIAAGMDWAELTEKRVGQLIANTFPFFSVDTLEYLMKGGRIGKVTAMAGTMLNIKPVISFAADGQLQSVAKVRGSRQVQGKFLELLAQRLGNHTRYNLAVANGGAPQEMAQLKAAVTARFPDYQHIWEGELDATLSTYIGSGVLGAGIQILE